MGKKVILPGNYTIAEAAVAAGCRFYAGYPITPSSELAARMSELLPEVGGVFIQMEDEIASMGAVIGASLAGLKSLTATSGPGFSLKQEHIGMACIAEVPCVIVNVMRGGPSTGLPTKPSQGDVMQARWGTHGDHYLIVLAPTFPNELYLTTIDAFNLSEKFRTPVIILIDEVLAHSHEVVEIPDPSEYTIVNRELPSNEKKEIKIYEREMGKPPVYPNFFSGWTIHIESLEHDEKGYPTTVPSKVEKLQLLRKRKIEDNLDEIIFWKEHMLEDAEVMVFAFGTSGRSGLEAVKMARKEGIKAGLFQPITIWPFPEKVLKEKFKKIKKVIVVEMNLGQIIYEVERISDDSVNVEGVLKMDGTPVSPLQVLSKIKEVLK